MAEFIADLLKPGFPKYNNSGKSFRTDLEYVGDFDTLSDEQPGLEDSWGTYAGTVSSTKLEPIEGTDRGTLRVTLEYFFNSAEFPSGTKQEESYEVDWEDFTRSMYEHPQFALGEGGQFQLDGADIADIENWKLEKDRTIKEAYSYVRRVNGKAAGEWVELSDNAKMFARGLELGQENFHDKAPIVRKTTRYTGGPPGEAQAGRKEDPPTVPNLPEGYEWRKEVDRAIRAEGQTKWDRIEEWHGAKKVLHDSQDVFWEAP